MNQKISLQEHIAKHSPQRVCLHLGCGGMKWGEFINVDLYPYQDDIADSSREGCVADVFADMRSLGLESASIDEIFTSHTIDHFPRWEAIDMFSDWYRMLRPGGLLCIEAADFFRCVLWLFHPFRTKRVLGRTQFYGNQWDRIDFETHRYLWSAKELKNVLVDIGFKNVTYSHKTYTHHPGRDMRITAYK